MQVQIQALQQHVIMQSSLNVVALEICVRAFSDKVLEAFYISSGKGSADSAGQAVWLRSRDAIEFCQEPGGKKMEIFGMKLKLIANMLKMMQTLRYISSTISRGCAHASTPIAVAYTLEGLSDLQDGGVLHRIFRLCFKMDTKDMIKQKETGELSQEYLRKFRIER